MKKIGMYLALAGLISVVLHFLDMNLTLLSWIDMWGETTGWLIRGGMILIGGALYTMGPEVAEEEGSQE